MATAFYTPSSSTSSADVLALESALADVKLTVSSATPLANAGTLMSRDNNAAAAVSRLTVANAPTVSTDAVNKAYVDAFASGITYKEACDYKTVAPLPTYITTGTQPAVTYTATANGALSIDGSTVAVGDRILLDQTISTPADGGIFVVTDAGGASAKWVLTRASDAQTMAQGTVTYVLAGATALNSQYALLNVTIVGTTAQNWAKLSDAGSSSNVNNALVRRDASGEFAAGDITASRLICSSAGNKRITLGYDNAPGDLARSDYMGMGSAVAGIKYNLLDSTQSHDFYRGNGSSAPVLLMEVNGNGTVNIPGDLTGNSATFAGSANSASLNTGTLIATSMNSSGAITGYNTTAATSTVSQPSPPLTIYGKIYNSTTGNVTMKSTLTTEKVTDNTNPTVAKLSFKVGTDNTTPTEQASLTNVGDLSLNGWCLASGGIRSDMDIVARNLTPSTSGAPEHVSPYLHLNGTLYNSSLGSNPMVCLINLQGLAFSSNPTRSKLNFRFANDDQLPTDPIFFTSNGDINMWGSLFSDGGIQCKTDIAASISAGATTSAANSSPALNLVGQVYNSSSGSAGMIGRIKVDALTNNASTTISKLSFLIGSDGNNPVEQAYVASNGQFVLKGGLKFPAAGTGGVSSLLNAYEEYDHVTTFKLGTATSASVTVKITRIGRLVSVYIPGVQLTPVAANQIFVMTTALPARFYPPSGGVCGATNVNANGAWALGEWAFSNVGVLTVWGGIIGVYFANGDASSQFQSFSTSWTV